MAHRWVVGLTLLYSQMLPSSDSVCKCTKGNEALSGNLVPGSAVLVEWTSMVMVMQKITKTHK